MIYTLHPGADADLHDAAEFYRKRAGNSLSRSLIEEFEHSVNLLLQHPEIGAPWRHGARRFLMKRFPYSIIYSTSSEEIRILAVAHHSRRPGYWRMRR